MVIEESRYTYPTQLTNSFDRENWTISTEHCYARPWDWRPEASFLRPTKTLFMPKLVPLKLTTPDAEELVDVETEVEVPSPHYDVAKAKALMDECESHALAARTDTDVDWEELVSKQNWTSNQNKVFNGMVNILNGFNLSKLAHTGTQNEPLLRRTVIDKAVQRLRRLLASVLWEPKLVQWLHQTMIDNLSPQYLGSYLDILQTLKSKLPSFLEKMMHTSSATNRTSLSNTNLTPLLEKPWDPVCTSLMQDKPKKLPGSPVILIVPSGSVVSKTVQKWTKLLTNLATVITIQTSFGSTGHRMTIPSILDQLFAITRGKIQDIREEYPGKNIILIGFNSGAALALQIAQIEPVLCVVSVGFSLLTMQGFRGEPDDAILELQCPVLFVIGQRSNTSNQEDLENLRENMRVETGLLVVGCADDYLRINKKKKRQEGITQSIVNRCIVDEIGEFVSGLILSPYPPQVRPSSAHIPPEIPVKKVGRPPGSKTKNRLETRWNQNLAQARKQVLGMGKNVFPGNSSVTNLLQGGIKTLAPTPLPSSGIKATLGQKYITSKKQLIAQKPPTSIKKSAFKYASNIETTLPPSNLTTQDIMDLPIIFADDNQIINSNSPSTSHISANTFSNVITATSSSAVQSAVPLVSQVTKPGTTTTKYMVLNKNSLGQSNFILTPNVKKMSSMTTFNKPMTKYTRILLSSKKATLDDEKTIPKIANVVPSQLGVQSGSRAELDDIENLITASTLHKPISGMSDTKSIKIISKIPRSREAVSQIKNAVVKKRSFSPMKIDKTDPDYMPAKLFKTE